MRLLNSIILLTIFLGLISCSSTKNISGTYRSNFADLGMFITKVTLKSDSSFKYRFRGDLIFDTAAGRYRIDNRKLILIYDPRPIDTSGLSTMRSMGFKLDSPLTLKSDAGLPHIFYIRRNKLFHSRQDEGIVKRATKYNKTKKYLFFGNHYYKRKWYLKRVD
jgi:hypothetical protein